MRQTKCNKTLAIQSLAVTNIRVYILNSFASSIFFFCFQSFSTVHEVFDQYLLDHVEIISIKGAYVQQYIKETALS